ncbi:vWA domain-containing protein [Gilvimarinus agarilyticus]|uniref:vWA domain-containing protein n=1 Tax=Gilvimarinus agarilyticus TaxID=679259 RepID=UPI0005A2164F|nr:vWA domain-containing protein [Gilvimarinus agarilyticus]
MATLLLPFFSAVPGVADEPLTPADVRLLVDVSGSMNQSDPQNLRSEGLTLLSRMLPAGTRAGLWSFAGSVNEVVPAASVDANWRQRALESLQKLRSNGQLTDIGAALARAGRAPKNAAQAHIILLTDGKVDIHSDSERNARERDSILTELIPNLVARGFVVHTIALSVDADADLLQRIASTSAGEHRVVTNRDQLVSVFVEILDQAVPPQRLPLTGDGFHVDAHVEELTVLMYHPAQADTRPHLLDPKLARIGQQTHAAGVRWVSRPHYDLVTIPKPQSGRWQLVDGGSETRVSVLTDLSLQVQPLAPTLVPGEPIMLDFSLRERGQLVIDNPLLEQLRARVSIAPYNHDGSLAAPRSQNVTLIPADERGHFLVRAVTPETPGRFQLNLRVDGATFSRQYQRNLAVEPKFRVQLNKSQQTQDSGTSVNYQLTVTAAPSLDSDNTELVAHVKDSTGASAMQPLARLPSGGWGLTITPDNRARYVVELQAKGADSNGRVFSEALPSQYFSYPAEGDPQEIVEDDTLLALEQALLDERAALARERNEPLPQPEQPVVASSAQSSSLKSADEPPKPAEESGTRWWLIALIALFNVALLALVYWLYRRFSGKSMEEELGEIEQQLSDEQAPADEEELEAGAFDDVFADMGDLGEPAVQLDSDEAGADKGKPAAPDNRDDNKGAGQ